jgi:hypothetical protein
VLPASVRLRQMQSGLSLVYARSRFRCPCYPLVYACSRCRCHPTAFHSRMCTSLSFRPSLRTSAPRACSVASVCDHQLISLAYLFSRTHLVNRLCKSLLRGHLTVSIHSFSALATRNHRATLLTTVIHFFSPLSRAGGPS